MPKVLKIKSVLPVYALIFFKFFGCLFMENIEDEVLACCYETLPNCENPSRNPFKMLIAGSRL
jgi:hypothetical protein